MPRTNWTTDPLEALKALPAPDLLATIYAASQELSGMLAYDRLADALAAMAFEIAEDEGNTGYLAELRAEAMLRAADLQAHDERMVA